MRTDKLIIEDYILNTEALPGPGMYLDLYGVRDTVDQEEQDWNEKPVTIGPFTGIRMVYDGHLFISRQEGDTFHVTRVEGMIPLNGKFYSDAVIFSA